MTIEEYLNEKTYPGRILIGGSTSEGIPILIYAVMGRSKKSQNRILRLSDGRLETKLYDNSLSGDNLILYSAKAVIGNKLLLGNGDHVSIIEKALNMDKDFNHSLSTLYPEPDEPNYTPRIAMLYDFDSMGYKLAIVRKGKNGEIERVSWNYPRFDGYCHIIHTYYDDGNPLLPFYSDPILISVGDDFLNSFWYSLNEENRVAVYSNNGKDEIIINQREV